MKLKLVFFFLTKMSKLTTNQKLNKCKFRVKEEMIWNVKCYETCTPSGCTALLKSLAMISHKYIHIMLGFLQVKANSQLNHATNRYIITKNHVVGRDYKGNAGR